MVVLPAWLDQVPSNNFEPEKAMLTQIENWAQENGWIVSDGRSLPIELRQRTDILLERPELDQRVRIAVLQKSRNSAGVIRLDSSNIRTVELVYQKRLRRWRVEVGGIPIEDDLLERGVGWLIGLMFKP